MKMKQKDRDIKWFAKADLKKYEYKYVAIVNKKVVASSDDPEKAYNEALKKNKSKEIILWKALGNESLVLHGSLCADRI